MPDNKSLQQQAEEYAKANASFSGEWPLTEQDVRELLESAHLAAATKYISEIEARDKKIKNLEYQLRLANIITKLTERELERLRKGMAEIVQEEIQERLTQSK